MIEPKTFMVSYVTTTRQEAAEEPPNRLQQHHQLTSNTNEVGEVFTDLYYKHRHEALVGIEILTIAPE